MRPSRRLLYLMTGWLLIAAISGGIAIAASVFPWLQSFQQWSSQFWFWSGWVILILALLDLFSLIGVNAVTAERKVSQNIAVGTRSKVTIKLINQHSRSLSLFVNDHYPAFSQVNDLPQTLSLKPNETVRVEYSIKILQRGDAVFDRLRLLVGSRLQLWQRVIRTGKKDTIKVYPNFAAIHDYLLLSADQQTTQMGIRLSQKRGDGLEFHQLREYRLGDSLRQIDWRATSRLGKLISKEYQEEKDQNIIFLLDCGRRMRTQDQELSHFDHSLNAMLLLAYIGLKQGDAVGMLSFGGVSRWVAPQKGTQFINTLLNQVYDCHPTLHASDFITAATELNKRIRKRSLIVLISNCRNDDITELDPAIQLLNKHHLVMLANLRENALDQSIEEPITTFEQSLRYCETVHYLQQRNQVHNHCANQGVIALDTVPGQLATRIVNSYFDIKRSGKL